MNKTSILAETLAEIQEIKKGIDENANYILKSTLKEDLEAIVRKGLNETEEEELQSDDMVGNGEPTDLGSEIEQSEEMPSTETGIDPTMDPTMDSVLGDELDNAEVIDLTNEPFDKVVDTFERMQLTDEIEIVKTPEGGIQINIEPQGGEGMMGNEPTMGGEEPMGLMGMGDDESPIEEPTMGDEEPSGEESPIEEPSSETPEEDDDETMKEENEVVYEIEISSENPVEEGSNEKEPVEETENKPDAHMKNNEMDEDVKHVVAKSHMKHNTEELHESLISTRKKLQALVTENKIKVNELEKVNKLVEQFKEAENEYKLAIKNLKGQLKEVALFTSNLTYAVKLMTENSTTKDEKLDIIKRFDSIKTLTESREVYNNLESLFKSSKKTVERTIEERVLETPKSSGSTNLNESTAYKNPQLERMLDIIGKIK